MKIILSTHTATGFYFRGIDGFQTIAVVKSTSWRMPQEDGTIKARKDFDGRTLEVVYAEYDNKRVIITAYYVD